MKTTQITIDELLAFDKLTLNFCSGINVLIGENATGKTHVMKLAYAMLRALGEYDLEREAQTEQRRPFVTDKLNRIFRPDDNQIGRLVHRGVGRKKGSAELRFGTDGFFRVGISTLGKVTRKFEGKAPRTTFIPSREVLAIYPGFTAAYENRELAFDETYYDICKSLAAAQFRGPRQEQIQALIKPILNILGGRVLLKGERFVLHSKRGNLEAPLLSEGFRKLGALAHLIANGTLTKQSILFWDEPEASLNPRLVTVVAQMLRTLANNGVQIVLATHDFLLSQELSLAVEYETEPRVPIQFIALSRQHPTGRITAQCANDLVELKDNPILAEFAAHYDREQKLVHAEGEKIK